MEPENDVFFLSLVHLLTPRELIFRIGLKGWSYFKPSPNSTNRPVSKRRRVLFSVCLVFKKNMVNYTDSANYYRGVAIIWVFV